MLTCRVFITAAAQLIQDHKIETGWLLVSARDLIGFSLLGGTLSGACISFNGWAMEKRGPVLVSLFSPIGTVCSVVLLVITLGEFISVGRHSCTDYVMAELEKLGQKYHVTLRLSVSKGAL
ncbi:hypothetical protein RchiOBHm_Chr3g0450311 [Rosa chinensis]|uniref:Uncharacterized protein n=1 Tax=Rosa chinensis TaxID=74649 RepID=A0A2P6R5R3_ROSCH|nr:hypothetical protein RchiOBHm_Chr3g0450311 [Rosa chinensis]